MKNIYTYQVVIHNTQLRYVVLPWLDQHAYHMTQEYFEWHESYYCFSDYMLGDAESRVIKMGYIKEDYKLIDSFNHILDWLAKEEE